MKAIRRRDFLGMTVAGAGLPSLLGAVNSNVAALSPFPFPETPITSQWDYQAKPVKVANPDLEETWNSGSHFAFDGYGGSRHPNSIAHGWFQEGTPSEQRPFVCTIDYGEAVAITKFVHYFYVPSVKDYRTDPFLLSTAFESLRIYRSEDGTSWALAEQVKDIPSNWPQVITLSRPVSARHYKLEVTGLEPGAPGMRTYEIESFTGPVIHVPAAPAADVRNGESCTVSGYVVGATDPSGFDVRVEASSHIQAPAPVRVEASGAFRVSFSPLSCGAVPVALDLTTRQGALVDRRTIVLKVTSRITVSEVTARAEAVFGHLVNVGTGSVAVQVGVGDQSDSVGPMRPGGESEFRLPRAAKAGGLQAVQLWVKEDDRIASHWAFALDPVEGATIAREGRFYNEHVEVGWSAQQAALRFDLRCRGAGAALRASLDASFDGSPLSFSVSEIEADSVTMCGRHANGLLECNLMVVRSALRLVFRNVKNGLQEEKASGILALRLKPEGVAFRFMPAYLYSKEPISYFEGVYGKQPLLRGGWSLPTRMLALETTEGTVGLVPDRDRCLMGIEQSDGMVSISAGEEPTEVLIPVVAGDWFECFRYVATDIYGFTEPRQYRPLIDCVTGEANYLAHNEDIWSRTMQVVTSFPKQDYVYTFYGLSYTIPALYAWYQMSGDEQALARARACVSWLLEYPGVRIKDGPTAGAFFSQYVSPDLKTFEMGSLSMPVHGLGGCDQANNRWLEPHATGAVAWTLVHYYVADGQRDHRVLEAAKAALDWLLKIQNSDGGWLYAYGPEGAELTEEEDAGNIWNIWALFRYGKLTGQPKYMDAAAKAKEWFASRFLTKHICRGYWEDVSGGNGRIGLSWEAYEFGIAANVFAEMRDKELAVEAARNAITWIWTRVVDYREYANSYGHAHEQWNWPPATYVAPMFGLAAQTAFRLTGDELFRRFSGAAKTIGWWIVRTDGKDVWPQRALTTDIGGAFWPLEGTEFVPLVEPFDVTFWVDWISAQQCTVCLRWLIQEVNLRSGGRIQVDPETLGGTILGKPGHAALRPGEVKLTAGHGQINWLGYRTGDTRVLAVLNHDEGTQAKVEVLPVPLAAANVLVGTESGVWRQESRTSASDLEFALPRRGCALVVWPFDAA